MGESGPGPGPDGDGAVMTASADRKSCTSVLPPFVPWLHTVTVAVKELPGTTLAGPLTALTTKSGPLPTPIRPPASELLLSMSSGWLLFGSTMAPRYQALSAPGAGGGALA